jgi:hypothetical protein
MKSPFEPQSYDDFLIWGKQRNAEMMKEYYAKKSTYHGKPKVVNLSHEAWSKREEKKKDTKIRIERIMRDTMNTIDKRVDWTIRSKSALYTSKEKVLKHMISVWLKEVEE